MHHKIAMDLGHTHSWGVAIEYDIQQHELSSLNPTHDPSSLNTMALTVIMACTSIQQLPTPTFSTSKHQVIFEASSQPAHKHACACCFHCGASGHLPSNWKADSPMTTDTSYLWTKVLTQTTSPPHEVLLTPPHPSSFPCWLHCSHLQHICTYHLTPIQPDQQHHLCISWNRLIYIDHTVMFGLALSAGVFSCMVDMLVTYDLWGCWLLSPAEVGQQLLHHLSPTSILDGAELYGPDWFHWSTPEIQEDTAFLFSTVVHWLWLGSSLPHSQSSNKLSCCSTMGFHQAHHSCHVKQPDSTAN